jgi:hypothetical protein
LGIKDRFDLWLTAASREAVDNYIAALDLLLSANTGAEKRLARAVDIDPEFALAHIAYARLLQLQGRMPEARQAATRAKALRGRLSVREQQHVEAIALAVEGAATQALAMVRMHASEYPRDALPLSLALGVFGLLGFSGRVDHHEAQLALLQELAPHWGAIGGFSVIWAGPISKPGRSRSGPGWSSDRSLAIRVTLMRLISEPMVSSNQGTRREAPISSKLGYRITSAPGICTAISRGISRCSSWHAAMRSGRAKSISTASGHRSPSRRRCSRLPTRRRFFGAGGFMS